MSVCISSITRSIRVFAALAAATGFVYGKTMPGALKNHGNPPDTLASRLDANPVIRTMERELQRSFNKLHIKGNPKPYFISYLLWDVRSYHMQAALGSKESSEKDHQHLLEVDLRVGDYRQDNSNFQGGIVFGPRLRLPLPQENDTDLIALSLWAATDAKYKVALEQLEQKRAFLAGHNGKDTLPDFSRQKVLRQIHGDDTTVLDTAGINATGKDLSRVFMDYPWLEESRVGYQYYYTTFYYVDSDGSRYIESVKEHTLLVSLLTQAKDGAPLWDYLRVSTRAPLAVGQGAFSTSALRDSVAPLIKRLDYLRNADPLPNYRGPILFTGTAAGELLNKSLLFPQSRLREPLGAGVEPNFMLSLSGRKLFPNEVTVVDTPGMADFRGQALFGHYAVDQQGQPAETVRLVSDGRVTGYLLGKVPVLKVKDYASNGHWRYGGGFPGVTVLRSSKAVSERELQSRLAALGSDEGTGYGLVVSKLLDEDAYKLLHHPLAAQLAVSEGLDGRGVFTLSTPCEMDRLDSHTGKVTAVRGLSFPVLDSKSLRDIAAIGNMPYLTEPQASFSILCPSLLFSLLDMKGSHNTQPRLPYLP